MPAANTKPYQIIAGVTDLYVAPVGTAFPAVDATPGSAWTPLGHSDGGVRVQHAQTIVELRTDQVTAPVKGVRSEEDLTITFSLAEVTEANYAMAMNRLASGATTSGTDKIVPLYRGGFGVETFAFLARGNHLSPHGDFNLQYEVPAAYQNGDPEVAFTKDAKALLAVELKAMGALAFDPGADDEDIFGVLRVGTV